MYLKVEKLGQSKLRTMLVPQFIILLLRSYCRKKQGLSSNVTSKASSPWASGDKLEECYVIIGCQIDIIGDSDMAMADTRI